MTVTFAIKEDVAGRRFWSSGCTVLTTVAVPAALSVGTVLVAAGVQTAMAGSVGVAVAAGTRVCMEVAVCWG
jgi:hypothetical protein